MNKGSKKYGVTGPLSLKESTKAEIKFSEKLNEFLEASGFFESEEQGLKRERVLGKLDFLVKEFVIKMYRDKGDAKQLGGKIFTFGSYRLGVHSKGADIDTLCIVPKHVNRTDFFTVFYDMLKADENVKDLSKIEDAYVPLIKFVYQDIPIDLVFSKLNLLSIKNDINLLNNLLLKNMDEKDILSLNGSRVTDEILMLVPNTSTFHSALRCIKYWAKKRGVYGNSYGYWGGVAYALGVARVCQLYPNACSYTIVLKFFELFSKWKWPTPVILKEIEDFNFNLKVWDPKLNPSDRYHKMPVITPAYPSMCSTHNVTTSTLSFMTTEFSRAFGILESYSKSKTDNIEEPEHLELLSKTIKSLFLMTDFFIRYKQYIMVQALSKDGSSLWDGFVESKIRVLCQKLESLEVVCIPFPKSFKKDNSTSFFVALDFSTCKLMINKKLFIDKPVNEFLDFLNQFDKKEEGMEVKIKVLKKNEIGAFMESYYGKKSKRKEEGDEGAKKIKATE